MAAEADVVCGAGYGERTLRSGRTRNGYRSLATSTPGRDDRGRRSPSCAGAATSRTVVEPRRRAEQALVAVVGGAYVHGVSTRKVEGSVRRWGSTGSRRARCRLCETLDEEVERFRGRPLEGGLSLCLVGRVCEGARDGGRVVSTAVVIAIGVNGDGQREVLGLDVARARTARSGSLPAQPGRSRPQRGPDGDQRCPPGPKGAIRPSCTARAGSAAGSTSSATC